MGGTILIDAPRVPNGGNPGRSEHCITSMLVETPLRPGFFRVPRQAVMARVGRGSKQHGVALQWYNQAGRHPDVLEHCNISRMLHVGMLIDIKGIFGTRPPIPCAAKGFFGVHHKAAIILAYKFLGISGLEGHISQRHLQEAEHLVVKITGVKRRTPLQDRGSPPRPTRAKGRKSRW
ncbi:hypothetical protein TESG_08470 [Trichophyton tonsurans CBS 112818]|uniref:Uncharacterized protein n=1 Tax=Trichophyton tonsurans (strain CBS 112818) TaxID=647933 RepID=F2S075_TRIT1|nr:hypothetical protein TESG_08470 [Trichophyton tonsurans CBS 112818]